LLAESNGLYRSIAGFTTVWARGSYRQAHRLPTILPVPTTLVSIAHPGANPRRGNATSCRTCAYEDVRRKKFGHIVARESRLIVAERMATRI
jgi:hypothetical protein